MVQRKFFYFLCGLFFIYIKLLLGIETFNIFVMSFVCLLTNSCVYAQSKCLPSHQYQML